MTILARLAALEAATAANTAALAAHGDTLTSFATVDDVNAISSKMGDLASSVGGRLDTVEAEIGTEPVAALAGAPVNDPAPATASYTPTTDTTASAT